MQFITKVFTLSGFLGSFGGVAYATSYYLTGYTLGDVLKDKGHTLLNFDPSDSSDDASWKTVLSAYSKGNKKLNGQEIKVANVESITKEEIEKLKKECSKATSSNRYDSNTSTLTENFCVKPVSIKDLISKKGGVKFLDSKGATNDDLWKSKISTYLTSKPDKNMREVNLVSEGDIFREENLKNIKAGCSGLEAVNSYQDGFQNSYNNFLDWCIA